MMAPRRSSNTLVKHIAGQSFYRHLWPLSNLPRNYLLATRLHPCCQAPPSTPSVTSLPGPLHNSLLASDEGSART
jgi:hypothetical protein